MGAPTMLYMNEIGNADLEIVGFNGSPVVECGRALAVARRKADEMHCVLGSAADGARNEFPSMPFEAYLEEIKNLDALLGRE
jgi:hypothetical protein